MKSHPPPHLSGMSCGTKLRHKKRWAFLWSVIHKVVEVNEWCGKISVEIDKNCPHYSPQSVESVEHRFYSCPLAQQGWPYTADIIWQLFAQKQRTSIYVSFYI